MCIQGGAARPVHHEAAGEVLVHVFGLDHQRLAAGAKERRIGCVELGDGLDIGLGEGAGSTLQHLENLVLRHGAGRTERKKQCSSHQDLVHALLL
jgi:hypothetical protein